MSEDENVPITINRDASAVQRDWQQKAPDLSGPQVREGVDAGADVIDLAAMIRQFEADPSARRRPGDKVL